MEGKSPQPQKRKRKPRSKAKQLARKEEREKTDRYWKLVDEANKVQNPIEHLVSFQHYEKNDLHIDMKCKRLSDLEQGQLQWAFCLTKTNMEELYKVSWGWNDKEKMRELSDDRMWYLLASSNGNTVAFSSFRFDLDFGEPVLYCYEIQLSKSVQGKGLGTFMMQILQLLAARNGMSKVMSTVLHCNDMSMKFYVDKLKFTVDDTSPGNECYDILSKYVKKS